jgi:heme-degrading monooxygenase HmoA
MTNTILRFTCIAALGLTGCPSDDDDDDAADSQASESSTASTSSADSTTQDASASTSADSSGGELDSSTTADPFADCDRGTLEPDLMGGDGQGNPAPLMWMGPGADPDTGELIDDGGTYVVSSTYLALRPEPAAQQAFGESTGPLVPELLGNPGMVAVQLGTSMQCSSARTLTVWQSEEAMMAFVTSDAHSAAIARVGEISRGDSLVTHWSGATIPEVSWDDALAHVLADDGPFY